MTVRCLDGRLFAHRPFPDDPDFEHDVGACPREDIDGCPARDCPLHAGPVDANDLEPLPLNAYEGCHA